MGIQWVNPKLCHPPHKLTHPEKFEELYNLFKEKGWGKNYPALTGYYFDGIIQLISGTHRWNAALDADILIPVAIYDFSYMESIWGTDRWIELIKNPVMV